MTVVAPDTIEARPSAHVADPVDPAPGQQLDDPGQVAPSVASPEPSTVLTGASAVLSTGAASVLVGGMFVGPLATILPISAVLLGASLVVLSFSRRRPALLQWMVLPTLLIMAFASGSMVAGAASRNPLELVMSALRSGGIEQPPVPFDPGWRIITVILMGGLAAGVTMVAAGYRVPKLAVFLPVPLTFGALLLQPPSGGELRTGLALAMTVMALVLGFGVDLGQQGQVSASFHLRRMVRGAVGLLVLLVALGGLTQLDFLFPPPRQTDIVPPQKPQPPPPQEDRVLFEVRSEQVLPWRLGTLDSYDGMDWLTPTFDRSRLQPLGEDGRVRGEIGSPSEVVSVTYTLRGMHDRVIPTLAGAHAIRSSDGAAMQVDPETQMLRLVDLPIDGQTYSVDAVKPPSGEQLRNVASVPEEFLEYLDVPAPPAAVQLILDQAPAEPLYDRLQYVRAAYYRSIVAAGEGKPASMPPARVAEMLGGDPASPYEITAAEALMARWAGIPSRFGYGYYDGEDVGDGIREIRPVNGATWLEVYFDGHGWVPLLGTPPRAQGSLTDSQNPNPTVRPAEDLALVVYVPVQQPTIRLFYMLARYWVARILPVLVAIGLLLWSYPALFKVVRRVRRQRWAANHGPREQIAAAYLELRDLATDLNIGTPALTPLEFLDHVEPDDDHLELAWLVTRAVWGDLQRDCQASDVIPAEEAARSLAWRLRGAQPTFNRVLAAVSRASLRNPTSDEIPNFWWRRPSLSLPRVRLPRPVTVGALLAITLLLSACSQGVPLQSGDRSGMPDRIAPAELAGYELQREPSAEVAYVEAGPDALVEPGEVYLVKDGLNVQASVQIAPFKRALLDAGRDRELRDSVLAAVGGGLTLRRLGDVTYRIQESGSRTVLVYLPPDTTYMMLLVARPSFGDAESLLGALVNYQRGRTETTDGIVAELPNPLRGIAP